MYKDWLHSIALILDPIYRPSMNIFNNNAALHGSVWSIRDYPQYPPPVPHVLIEEWGPSRNVPVVLRRYLVIHARIREASTHTVNGYTHIGKEVFNSFEGVGVIRLQQHLSQSFPVLYKGQTLYISTDND